MEPLELIPQISFECCQCQKKCSLITSRAIRETAAQLGLVDQADYEAFRDAAENAFDTCDYYVEIVGQLHKMQHVPNMPDLNQGEHYGVFKGHYVGLTVCKVPVKPGQCICRKCDQILGQTGQMKHIWSH